MHVYNEKNNWISAHLHYSGLFNLFLLQAVKPFVESILTNKLADQFFFIRYWDKGPHIRLRIKGDPQLLELEVKPALTSHFQNYFNKYPSNRVEPAWVKNLPKEQQWLPDNSIQFIEYEPEIERYGGQKGILIAERQFQASSKAILSILTENSSLDYNRALGIAIQLHIGFAYSMDMDLAEVINFFTYSSTRWSTKAFHIFGTTNSEKDISARKHEAFEAFKTSFNMQKEGFLPLLEMLWNVCERGEEVEQQWFNIWLTEMKIVKHQLTQAYQAGELLKAKKDQPIYPNKTLEQICIWPILDSYIHMSNNRLGIQNHDEGYLGYILKEGFKETSPSF